MNWDWILGAVVLVVWLVAVLFIFPKMGVPTWRTNYKESGTRKKKC